MSDYWDTSCLLKLYCREEDSARFLEEIASARRAILTSVLTQTEIYFAFQQKSMRGETCGRTADELIDDFAVDVQRGYIQLLPLGEDVFASARSIAALCYSQSPALHLRSLDGLHLGTAQTAACRRLLSVDSRMNAAARLLGMSLVSTSIARASRQGQSGGKISPSGQQ